MGQFRMGGPGFFLLQGRLRFGNEAPGRGMGRAFVLQLAFEVADAGFELALCVLIVTSVEHHDRHAAILYEFMPGSGLVGTLLRRMPGAAGGAAEAECEPHPAFGILVVCNRGGGWFWCFCHGSVELKVGACSAPGMSPYALTQTRPRGRALTLPPDLCPTQLWGIGQALSMGVFHGYCYEITSAAR